VSDSQKSLSDAKTQSAAQKKAAFDTEQQTINTCNTEASPPPDCVALAENTFNQAVAQADANVTTAQNQVNTNEKALTTAQMQAAANNNTAQIQVNDDQKQLSSAVAQAATSNTTAQNQLNSAQSAIVTAQTQGAQSNTTAQNQINAAQSQLSTAQANAALSNSTAQSQVTTAQGQFNNDLVQLQTAQHNLDNATLTAPHDGVVTILNGTVGGTPGVPTNITSSSSTTTAGGTFIQIVDTSLLQVLANVNESDTGYLKVGEPALFTVSAYGSKQFHGTISSIAPNGQTSSNVVTYPVYIDVDMQSLRGSSLLPNMTANVTITVVDHPNVLMIPVGAVNFARSAVNPTTGPSPTPALITREMANTALDQARQQLRELQNENPNGSQDNDIPAYVLERSGAQLVVKPVVLGLTDETVYEVVAGLSEGETIVVGVQR
jgi:HlyD family secretion protein